MAKDLDAESYALIKTGQEIDAFFTDTEANIGELKHNVNTLRSNLTDHRTNGVLDHPNGSVTASKIANYNVTADKLSSNSVETGKIVDGAVTIDKLGSDVLAKLSAMDNALTQTEAEITRQHSSDVTTLSRLIGNEATARESADENLQTQINNLPVVNYTSDVFGNKNVRTIYNLRAVIPTTASLTWLTALDEDNRPYLSLYHQNDFAPSFYKEDILQTGSIDFYPDGELMVSNEELQDGITVNLLCWYNHIENKYWLTSSRTTSEAGFHNNGTVWCFPVCSWTLSTFYDDVNNYEDANEAETNTSKTYFNGGTVDNVNNTYTISQTYDRTDPVPRTLADLTTTDKTSIVSAINELVSKPSNSGDATDLENITEVLNNKVDKVSGYGLSQRDFTIKYKAMIDALFADDIPEAYKTASSFNTGGLSVGDVFLLYNNTSQTKTSLVASGVTYNLTEPLYAEKTCLCKYTKQGGASSNGIITVYKGLIQYLMDKCDTTVSLETGNVELLP